MAITLVSTMGVRTQKKVEIGDGDTEDPAARGIR